MEQNFKIEETKYSVVILKLSGRLDIDSAMTFEKKLVYLFASGEKYIIFDFEDVEYITSYGIRVLLMGMKKSIEMQGKIVMFGLSEQIEKVLKIVGVLSQFNISNNKPAALESIFKTF